MLYTSVPIASLSVKCCASHEQVHSSLLSGGPSACPGARCGGDAYYARYRSGDAEANSADCHGTQLHFAELQRLRGNSIVLSVQAFPPAQSTIRGFRGPLRGLFAGMLQSLLIPRQYGLISARLWSMVPPEPCHRSACQEAPFTLV